jgi:hypothetical protein
MVKNEQHRLHGHWFDVAFALAWIGALSVYWIHIKDERALPSYS